MRWMIASDIHGSAYYCRKMIEAYRREKADKLLLLGDILYHGPRNDLPKDYAPKEVIAMLNEIKEEILCVKGNCESEVDQMVLEFPIMADYCILYLNDRMIFATHGHVHNLEHVPMLKRRHSSSWTYTCAGLQRTDRCIYMNPGSISIPKEDSLHSYMILDEKF